MAELVDLDYDYQKCVAVLRMAFVGIIDHQPRSEAGQMMVLVALDKSVSRKSRAWLTESMLREVSPSALAEYYINPSPVKASASIGGGTPVMPAVGSEITHVLSRFTRRKVRAVARMVLCEEMRKVSGE